MGAARMTIQSMTGFARIAGQAHGRDFAWELRAVNGRALDMRFRLPPGFESLGDEARKLLAGSVSRGTIHITLQLGAGDARRASRINADALTALVDSLAGVKLPAGIGPATLDGLLTVRGVVEHGEEDALAELEKLHAPLMEAFAQARTAFLEARAGEGRALARILGEQVERIAALSAQIEEHPARSSEAIRARLAAQITALLDASRQFDENRLHQEAALIATRSDVREELDRLAAHVVSARELIAQGGPVGRRLDFLSQEFGREASTLCAKANDVALSRIGLELRATVDQLREQVQNVE
jgi:uncharacterized protein (TIGR00255 family)